MKFARAVLDLVEPLKQGARGQPSLPDGGAPTALYTMTQLEWQVPAGLWKYADFAETFNYLRGSKRLVIPEEWRDVIPRKMKNNFVDGDSIGDATEEELLAAGLVVKACPVIDRFLAELHILVKKKQTFKLTIDQGWFSEHEMKEELNWSQKNAYDGVEEFWIVVKERARSTEESSYEELQHQRCVTSLEAEIKRIDQHYDLCNEAMAQGELDSYKCSKATALELKVRTASCAAAIRTARNFVADVGETAASRSAGLVRLAQRSEKNSERDTQRLMVNQFGLSLPIPKWELRCKDVSVPVLRLRDWVNYLLAGNHWHIVTGLVRPDWKREEAILNAFWNQYRVQEPNHPIFEKERLGEVRLSHCAPLLFHGDEGRGRKRSPFLVCSFYSILGRGMLNRQKPGKAPYLKQLPNFHGHTYTSRFLFAALPKHMYTGAASEIFDGLMELATDEVDFMFNVGLQDQYRGNARACLLNITGDWPWLAKSGNIARSFLNVQKHREAAACKGVCHLCKGGQPGYPYEEIGTRTPAWLGSLFSDDPFKTPPPFLRVAHVAGQGQALWFFDVFHTWHLGCAKHFLGSVLVLLAEREPQSNIELRFEALTQKYLGWCKQRSKRAFVSKLTKEFVNYPTTQSYPTGSWHKGALSTTLMDFVEELFLAEGWNDNDDGQMLRMAGEAAVQANSFLRSLYMADVWMQPSAARAAAEYGLRFLRRYGALAKLAFNSGRTLWVESMIQRTIQHSLQKMLGKKLGALSEADSKDSSSQHSSSILGDHKSQSPFT
eukprot:s983_g20.t1